MADDERGFAACSRNTFDEVASLYDEVRPGYPAEIIDAIVALAGLPPGGRILEIGCGTGQITLPFAARGYAILALEPGNALAALAAQKCRSYPRVDVLPTTFEAWPVERGTFDLALSAQAFHWIEPEYGCAKAAIALARGGALALVWHLDVLEHTAFWQATQPIYDTFFPTTADDPGVSLAAMLRRYEEILRRSEAFADLRQIRHAWERAYAGGDYLKLLSTFSNYGALPGPDRVRFSRAIAEVIDHADGVVHRRYETVLLLARRTGEG